MKPQWVSIEFDNTKCPALKDYNNTDITINIPLDGFICTSSPSYVGLFQRSYFVVDKDGNRKQLVKNESIWHAGTISTNQPSSDENKPDCNIKLQHFYYGSEDELRKEGASSIFQNENFLTNYHPECRNARTSVPKREPSN